MICVYCNGTGRVRDPAPWCEGDRCYACSGTGHVAPPPPPKVRITWGSESREGCARIEGVERFTVGVWSGRLGGFPVTRLDADGGAS